MGCTVTTPVSFSNRSKIAGPRRRSRAKTASLIRGFITSRRKRDDGQWQQQQNRPECDLQSPGHSLSRHRLFPPPFGYHSLREIAMVKMKEDEVRGLRTMISDRVC